MFTRGSCVVAAFSRIHLILQILFSTHDKGGTDGCILWRRPALSLRGGVFYMCGFQMLRNYCSILAKTRSFILFSFDGMPACLLQEEMCNWSITLFKQFRARTSLRILHNSKFKARINGSVAGFFYNVWYTVYATFRIPLHRNIRY